MVRAQIPRAGYFQQMVASLTGKASVAARFAFLPPSEKLTHWERLLSHGPHPRPFRGSRE